MTIAIVAAALALLTGLLVAEKTEKSKFILAFKTPLSILFVVTALLQPVTAPEYFHYILAGLILGLVGDVCLAIPGANAFRAGLVAFLLGHVLYVVAFASLVGVGAWFGAYAVVVVACSVGVFVWLLPHVGKMLVPVTLYVLVITAMVIGALAVYRSSGIAGTAAGVILLGAVLFYLSDLFVARDRFVRPGFINRLVGLPLYYSGQFLIAFSVGMVGVG